MKKTCAFCEKSKGKRQCQAKGLELVCPKCCAANRGHDCRGCGHYETASEYHSAKETAVQKRKDRYEINETIQSIVEDAINLINKNKDEKANEILQKLYQEYPDYDYVNYALGMLYAKQDRYEDAAHYLRRAVELYPYFLEAYYNLAAASMRLQDGLTMVQCYQKVIEIGEPTDELVISAKLHLKNFEQHIRETNGLSLKLYFKALEYFNLGNEKMDKQEWASAIQYFNKCLAINTQSCQSYNNIGTCYAKLGQKDLALKAYDSALAINPSYVLAQVNRKKTASKDEKELKDAEYRSVNYSQLEKNKRLKELF
jgi:tetratricopeptide (TPR) repeat protein